MDKLSELAARCEAATGPDRELDAEIAAAMHVKQLTYEPSKWIKDPEFTASFDAAMTLLPVDCLRLDMSTGDKFMWAVIYTGSWQYRGEGPTLALALCAAALRTRATLSGSSSVKS